MPFGEKEIPKQVSNSAQPSAPAADSPSLKVNFNDIWGLSPNDLWIVGTNGTILHHN